MSTEKPGLAEALRARLERPVEPFAGRSADNFDLLARNIARAFGEDPEQVVKELGRDTALTRSLRKAFAVVARPRRPRGRPHSGHAEFDVFMVDLFRTSGCSREEAIAIAAEMIGGWGRPGKDGLPITEDGLRSSYERAKQGKLRPPS